MKIHCLPLILLVSVLCLYFQPSISQPSGEEDVLEMPSWFWHQPHQAGNSYAVGYAPLYYYPASSYREAFANATETLWRDRCFDVAGSQASGWEGSGLMSLGAKFKFNFDTTGLGEFGGNVTHLDSAVVGDLVVVLIGTSPTEIDRRILTSPHLDDFHGTKPSGLIGIAAAPAYYSKTSGWLEAERLARIELALSASSSMKAMQSDLDKSSIYSVVVETDITLSGVAVLQRTYDPKLGVFWVMVSAEKWVGK
jgi:hypothetical protein